MSKSYEKLATAKLTSVGLNTVHPPELPELTHIDDAALSVLIDYQYQKAVTIDEHESIDTALLEMKASNVHMLLVTDKNKQVIGITSSKTILGGTPYRIMEENRITHAEVLVNMIMLPIDQALALDYQQLEHAKIGNLIETFKANKRHYALVIEESAEQKLIRGYFSASRISKSLGNNFTENTTGANTILELKNLLKELK